MTWNDRQTGAPELRGESDAEALRDTWEALAPEVELESVRSVEPAETDAAWARLDARLFQVEDARGLRADTGSSAPGSGRRPHRLVSLLAAAAVAALLGVSLVPSTRSAPNGASMALVLPGGSSVELNAGSSLRWTRGFGWIPGVAEGDRRFELDGEAFFEVVRDGRRFVVDTRDARVTVLGTRFNVRARSQAPTRVTVEEGRVSVADLDGGDRIELGAGQGGAIMPEGGVALDPTPDLRDLAWRSGGLTLRDMTVEEVVEALEVRFGTRIELRDRSADADRLTLHYSQSVEIETVLRDLATARGLEWSRTAEGWELFRE